MGVMKREEMGGLGGGYWLAGQTMIDQAQLSEWHERFDVSVRSLHVSLLFLISPTSSRRHTAFVVDVNPPARVVVCDWPSHRTPTAARQTFEPPIK